MTSLIWLSIGAGCALLIAFVVYVEYRPETPPALPPLPPAPPPTLPPVPLRARRTTKPPARVRVRTGKTR